MPITRIFLLITAGFAIAADTCPPTTGDRNGNYMTAGSLGDIEYSSGMTLDAYAPEGKPRPFAVLIHGSSGDKSTHMTQLFAVLEHAGYSWFSVDYRNADDIRAAIRYIRCPGRFNLNQHMLLIAEDTGAALATDVGAERLLLFGARFPRKPEPIDVPVLMVHGTADDESPIAAAEAICKAWKRCQFLPVAGGIHNFENWHPDQWSWKEDVTAWLRGDQRGLWKDIVYSQPGGRDLMMDAFIPEGQGPFPAVVIAHGGGWEAGDKVTYISPVLKTLARAGFAWFSIDYRLTPYVRNPEQLDDLRSAIRYVRDNAARFHVNPNRIAILGESASGQMVAQTPSEPCPACEVQAVVSFYGVYDFTPWANDADNRTALDRIFGRWNDDTLKRYSPLFHVRPDQPPILLIQGTKDDLYRGTLAYADRLKSAGARHELVVLDGAPHGMENWAGHPEWDFYKKRMVDWLHAALD
jgi:alpha-L-fucosidase 2